MIRRKHKGAFKFAISCLATIVKFEVANFYSPQELLRLMINRELRSQS